MSPGAAAATVDGVPHYRLHHRHSPEECGAAFAAWRGWSSPLRGATVISSCRFGGHEIWWDVECGSAAEALAMLPAFVAERTKAIPVGRLNSS